MKAPPKPAPEVLENAVCDGCNELCEFVQVIPSCGVAVGICLCRVCLETANSEPTTAN